MSQCTDVDKALKNLEDKIDAQNKEIARLKQLQQQCCNSKNSGNNSDLEARIKRLESYCRSLEEVLKKLNNNFKEIFQHIDDVFQLVIGVFK